MIPRGCQHDGRSPATAEESYMSKRNTRKRLARTSDLYGLQPVSKRRWRQILEVLGATCLNCGAQPVTRDHVQPIACGGLNHPANLQPLCRPCNNAKADRIIDYRSAEQRAKVLARWPLECAPVEKYVATPMRTSVAVLTG